MKFHKILVAALVLSAGFFGRQIAAAADQEAWDGTIVQYGKMHEAIGQKQYQGRVELKNLVGQPHFYGVAALKGLDGEATIVDGKVTVTRVDAEGQLKTSEAASGDESATLLVGAYVPAWTEHKVAKTCARITLTHILRTRRRRLASVLRSRLSSRSRAISAMSVST